MVVLCSRCRSAKSQGATRIRREVGMLHTVPAVSAWSRAALAVRGVANEDRAVGSCFVIDAQRGLLWTCSHIVGTGVGQTRQVGAAPAPGQRIAWQYEAVVLHSTQMQHQHGVDGALMHITSRIDGQPLGAPLTHADGQPLPALPLGDDAALVLPGDEPAVVLGYPGVEQTMTPTVGIYSARTPDGGYLATDARMLLGHSGGPGLNARGEVVGWNVRQATEGVDSGIGRVACGISHLRPVSYLVSELGALQGQAAATAFGNGGAPADVRVWLTAQPGCIAAGTHLVGVLQAQQQMMQVQQQIMQAQQQMMQAQQIAMQTAQAAVQEAQQHEQGALAHSLFSARSRDDAAAQATTAESHAAALASAAGEASGAADSAQASALQAGVAASAAGDSVQQAQLAETSASAHAQAAEGAAAAMTTALEEQATRVARAKSMKSMEVQLKAAIVGMGITDVQLHFGLIINLTEFVKKSFATRDAVAEPDVMQILKAFPSSSVILVIAMPQSYAAAIMKLARSQSSELVGLGFRCCQLGEDIVPLGEDESFTKYVKQLRAVPWVVDHVAMAVKPPAATARGGPTSKQHSDDSKKGNRALGRIASFDSSSRMATIALSSNVHTASWMPRGPLVGEPMGMYMAADIVRDLGGHASAKAFIIDDDDPSAGLSAIDKKVRAGAYNFVGQLVDDLEKVWLPALTGQRDTSLKARATEMCDATRSVFKDWPRESRICKPLDLSLSESRTMLARTVSKNCDPKDPQTGVLVFASDAATKVDRLRKEGLLTWNGETELNALLDEQGFCLAFLVDVQLDNGA